MASSFVRTAESYSSVSSSHRTENSITIIGLNPALQKRFILDNTTLTLTPGNVHRASKIQYGVGGKGQDVFTSLTHLSKKKDGDDASTISGIKLAQFLGSGAEGDKVNTLLSPYDTSFTIRNEAELRTCTTIVGSNDATELVDPSGLILPQEVQDLLQALDSQFSEDPPLDNQEENNDKSAEVHAVSIMGSMPPGCPPDLYSKLYSKIAKSTTGQKNPVLCLVDSVIGLEYLLRTMKSYRCGENHRYQNILKINLAELIKITNTKEEDISVSTEYDEGDNGIGKIINALYQTYPCAQEALNYVAITNGKDPSYLVKIADRNNASGKDEDDGGDLIYEIKIPTLTSTLTKQDTISDTDKGVISLATDDEINPEKQNVLYPIGAGDTVAAGTLASWQYFTQKETNRISFSNVSQNNRSWIDDRVLQSLSSKSRKDNRGDNSNGNHDIILISFVFGLACGSASCLQEENSVFDICDVLALFGDMILPEPRKMTR